MVEKHVNQGIAILMALIGMFVAIVLISTTAVALFPMMISSITGLGTLGNFTFAPMFASTGLVSIILSTVLLLAILGILVGGIYIATKYMKGGSR